MSKVLTIGEAMGLLIAEEMGPLEEVEHFSRHVCGAELNYAVGMARLGNDVSYISKVGALEFFCVGQTPVAVGVPQLHFVM